MQAINDDEFLGWCQQWDDAQAKGMFKDDAAPKVNQNSGEHSFFGPVNAKSKDEIDDVDSQYWKSVYSLSNNQGDAPDIIDILQENKDAVKLKDFARVPNPIRTNSVGKDQDLKPGPLGVTFSPKDVEDLAEIKLQIHALEDKINDFEGRGQNGKKFSTQLESLKKKMDDLSNEMTYAFPIDISTQGDR